MALSPESQAPEAKENRSDVASIKHLYLQICKMPELTEQARAVDQVLLTRLQDLKSQASALIDRFHAQKKNILQCFDNWIRPIAQDVLDGLLKDAQSLKHKLDGKLEHLDQTTPEEWEAEAKRWVHLYSKWSDGKLIDRILEVIADRTAHLIDKDIQMIHDYQTQSLSQLPQEPETFKNVEERLSQAIEEPLKQLVSLRNQAKEHKSIQQTSEWVAKLQEKRENYFNQLLMKIDQVMKDVVNLEETKDWTMVVEVEGEVLFMEKEFQHIKSDLTHLHFIEEYDKQFLLGRLEGLLEHVDDIYNQTLPSPLRARLENLKSGILDSISLLEEMKGHSA